MATPMATDFVGFVNVLCSYLSASSISAMRATQSSTVSSSAASVAVMPVNNSDSGINSCALIDGNMMTIYTDNNKDKIVTTIFQSLFLVLNNVGDEAVTSNVCFPSEQVTVDNPRLHRA